MVFNSYVFLLFFPIVVVAYYILPKKARSYWLLAASYYFYMSWNAKYALLILFSTVITYLTGLLLDRQKDNDPKKNTRKLFFCGCIAVNLGILFFFKYYEFFFGSLIKLLSKAGIEITIPVFDVLLPVGISFYTFQALGYCIDVYKGNIKAERNFFKYALFVSFFPQLVAGPIERSGNLLHQLDAPKPFSYAMFREGILLMMWGYFQKIVIADRIAMYVDTVYGDYASYPGMYLIVATILFAFQIYCDFGGYSNIAKGAAYILGIELMNNFESPYLSRSCGEFWRRWHISLSSWFRDYVYIPLGGNRKGRIRKYVNLIIVFGLSGLWHGASWTYVIWGLVNGLYQIIGDVLKKTKTRVFSGLGISRDKAGTKLAEVIITFALIDLSWIFFRAKGLGNASGVIKSMFAEFNPWILLDKSIYQCGLSEKGFLVVIVALLVLVAVDIANYKGIRIRNVIMGQDFWFRSVAFAVCIGIILVFGIWGTGYESDAFLYFQF